MEGNNNKLVDVFPKEVLRHLGYYVYRLVDPRDGNTFYVGMGKGNRVFDHVKRVLKFKKKEGAEDSESAKYDTIQRIHAANLEVITIIHRHNLSREEAFEVEGALIDAYPGLTNVQNGHGNADRGCANADEIIARYGAKEAKVPQGKYLLIKIRQSMVDERGSVYEAVRKHWRIDVQRANGLKVLACVDGVVRGVFIPEAWRQATGNNAGRYYFDGKDISKGNSLMGGRLPRKFLKKGVRSPIRYS